MSTILMPGNILVYKNTDMLFTIAAQKNKNILAMWKSDSYIGIDKALKTLLFVKTVNITKTHQECTFIHKEEIIETNFYHDALQYFLTHWDIVC